MLCAALVLSLAACGGGQTGSSTQPPAGSTSSGQQAAEPPAKNTDEQRTPEPENPHSQKDSPSEPENKKDDDSEPSPFITALKAEYENGLSFGQTKDHNYVPYAYISSGGRSSVKAFIDGDKVYTWVSDNNNPPGLYSYDVKTKTTELCIPAQDLVDAGINYGYFNYLDGWLYSVWGNAVTKMSLTGETMSSPAFPNSITPVLFDGGILCSDQNREQFAILSYDNLQITATIPAPQQEAKHGIMETARLEDNYYFAADGTVYGATNTNFYKLDMKNNAWVDQGPIPQNAFYGRQLCGEYFTDQQKVYNVLTGEEIFTYGVLYKSTVIDNYMTFSYFGGDEYIGVSNTNNGNEYRWVNLKDNTMSEPLTFPENTNTTIIDDTYCVYRDQYGVFLWNYITGEEDTIMMFQS